MLFIKKTFFKSAAQKTQFEEVMTQISVRRSTLLDLVPASVHAINEKKFLGYENEKIKEYMRLRTNLEGIFPKLIVHLPLDEDKDYYQIRLSWGTAATLLLLTIFIPILLWFMLSQDDDQGVLLSFFAAGLGYIMYIFAEFHFINKDISKALRLNGGKRVLQQSF